MRIYRKYRFIPQKYNENNNNMAYGGGYLWLWGGDFVVCVVGVWGCWQALNRLKINLLF